MAKLDRVDQTEILRLIKDQLKQYTPDYKNIKGSPPIILDGGFAVQNGSPAVLDGGNSGTTGGNLLEGNHQ